ncbi:ATP-binding protein [Actinosynnema sp. NPDC023587]|uniref:sensor histidine kinase n=1 Tax=Actinosynnema sp. NPDC023587 TaxID=3154695 RepID=UPI0033E98A11
MQKDLRGDGVVDVAISFERTYVESTWRLACLIRAFVVAVVSTLAASATPISARPLALALAGIGLVFAVADCLSASAKRTYSTGCATVLFAVAVSVLQPVLASSPTAFHPNEWSFAIVSITAITLQWQWPAPAAAAACAVLIVADAFGQRPDVPSTALAFRIAAESGAAWFCTWLALRNARRLDRMREEKQQMERQIALDVSRRRQEKEYLALLHDTASATLLVAASTHSRPTAAELSRYARRDLEILGHRVDMLATTEVVDSTALVDAVVAESPLAVEVIGTCQAILPLGPALALLRALREAMSNVERHAEVRRVRLRVAAAGRGVVLELTDNGIGFDPGAVPLTRHGISLSIVDRMASCGGKAEVRSERGRGATVRLMWPGA